MGCMHAAIWGVTLDTDRQPGSNAASSRDSAACMGDTLAHSTKGVAVTWCHTACGRVQRSGFLPADMLVLLLLPGLQASACTHTASREAYMTRNEK